MQNKKIPERMCVGCGEMKPKTDLMRVVKSSEGEVKIDLGGKAQGRGAYVCRNPECLKKVKKTHRLDKVFATRLPDEVYDTLIAEGEAVK